MFSVIFDMDGTLLDTQRICIPAWDFAGDNQGLENVGRHMPAVCGMNEEAWSSYLAERYPSIDLTTFKKDTKDYVIKNLKVKFMPGIERLLKFLKQNGIKIGLASGSSHEIINYYLNQLNSEDYFDVIVSGNDVEHSKPEPDIFLKTAELMGVNPSDCFVFEDSENGIRAGRAAGMKCVGIPDIVDFSDEVSGMLFFKLRYADEIIPTFSDLIKFFK